jgi:predicted DNA binding CopG/RHH family protein
MKAFKIIPDFKSELEEFEFWSKEDSMEFIDWGKAKLVNFPNLKKTSKEITLNLPLDLLEKIKVRANKIDVPFESLIKMYILKAYNDNTQSYPSK